MEGGRDRNTNGVDCGGGDVAAAGGGGDGGGGGGGNSCKNKRTERESTSRLT